MREQKSEGLLEDSNWLRYETTGQGRLGGFPLGDNRSGSVPDLPDLVILLMITFIEISKKNFAKDS